MKSELTGWAGGTRTEFEILKTRLKATWMSGDYDPFARPMERGAKVFFDRLGVRPGATLLDVACGTGQVALIAARAGVKATGCDIATNWLNAARQRASDEGLQAAFVEGDAEALPFDDDSFDVVASLTGAMFAPRPDFTAQELVRVCRPGGQIAMANWTTRGIIGQMMKMVETYQAPTGLTCSLLWGDPIVVRQRLGSLTTGLKMTLRPYPLEYDLTPEGVVDFFRNHYGPVRRAFESLNLEGRFRLREELAALWASHNRASGGRTAVAAEYLEVRATKPKAPRNAKNTA